MNIAQISFHYRPIRGGQELYIANLSNILREAGHSTKIFQPYRGEKASDIVPIFRIPFIARYVNSFDYFFFNVMLYTQRNTMLRHYDGIISHYAFHTPVVWDNPNKVLVLSHGIEWHTDSNRIFDRAHEAVANKSFTHFPLVVNDTHYLRHFGFDIAPKTGYFKEVGHKKWFIPNCVNTEMFKPSKPLHELSEKNIILVPRQITPDRGIDLAIKSFAFIADKLSMTTLYIVGGPTRGKYFNDCIKLVKKLGIEHRVIFAGYVPNHKMPSIYSSALLTLIPTRRREGTSLSALESMACGTATVSTDAAGLADLPTLQAPVDENALAEIMLKGMFLRIKLGQQQQQQVHSVFNISNWRKAWLEVIHKVFSN
jgi:glycosyltransferase involved in cell wall biosynthesis